MAEGQGVVVVGTQWGDEGKGKIVDLYAEHADVVVRFAGGGNAGHTMVVGGVEVITHQVPSGVLHERVVNVMGPGMVIDPAALLEEIARLQKLGRLQAPGSLLISDRAHVTFPYHRAVEQLRESGKTKRVGSTGKGIGPTYESKVGRRGIRIGDLLRPNYLRRLVQQNLEYVRRLLPEAGLDQGAEDAMVAEYSAHGEALKNFVADTTPYLHREWKSGKRILFEGAQGTLLDVDYGTYPFVTSSSTVAASACIGSGLGPLAVGQVIGVTKAYMTRASREGPFPTELHGPAEKRLRKAGGEYTTWMQFPRRCGWLDGAALRFAARLNSLSAIALTKLDVFDELEQIELCTGYRLRGEVLEEPPWHEADLADAQPVYETFAGWRSSLAGVRRAADLPEPARAYVRRVGELAGVPVKLISVGKERGETIPVHPGEL